MSIPRSTGAMSAYVPGGGGGGGGGSLPYMGYIGMCRGIGYGF